MKNVERWPEPDSLIIDAPEWRRQVQEHINRNEDPPDNLMDNYSQPDILQALREMYSDGNGRCLCCYCETPIVGSFPQIEHRKPKKKYPQHAFDWDNLHLVCQACNTAKRDKWDDENPILDAVLDDPISEHMGYSIAGLGVYRKVYRGKKRGGTTWKHADLDRDELLTTRFLHLSEVLQKADEVKELANDPSALAEKRKLRVMCKGAYGSMVKYYLDRFFPECWNDE